MGIRRLLLTLAGLASLLAAGNDALVYLRNDDAVTLDPRLSGDALSNELLVNVLEGLVRFRRGGSDIEPCLAERWESSTDARQWTFSLRRGVFFHDGQPLTAAGCAAYFRGEARAGKREPEKWQSVFSRIADARVLDDGRLRISLKRPGTTFLVSLATPAGLVPAPGARLAPGPAGTGPFRVSAWAPGRQIVLTRFEGYWGVPPPLAKVIVRVATDPLQRQLQVKSGVADVIQVLGAREYDELASSPSVALVETTGVFSYFLNINTRRAPFDRLPVRQALARLINRPALVRQVFQRMATPAWTILPPAMMAPDLPPPEPAFDPDAAIRLLHRTGYRSGFDASLYLGVGRSSSDEIADLIVRNARRASIRLHKVQLPLGQLLRSATRGDHDLLLIGWNGLVDPDSFLRPLLSAGPSTYNFSHYHNPALLRLLDQALQTVDPPVRSRIYRQALAVIDRDLPLLPLAHRSRVVAHRRAVRGLYFSPQGYLILREARKESP